MQANTNGTIPDLATTPARWIFTLQDLENAYWLLGEGLWILQETGWKQRLRANIKNFDSFTTHLLSYGWSFSVISLWILLFVLLKFIVIYNIVFLLNTDWEGFLFWRNQQIKKKSNIQKCSYHLSQTWILQVLMDI